MPYYDKASLGANDGMWQENWTLQYISYYYKKYNVTFIDKWQLQWHCKTLIVAEAK